MNISDGKHIDLEDIDTIIHEEESKHNPNNDQIDTGDGDDDDDTILDNSGNIKVEDTLYQFKVTVNTKELGLTLQEDVLGLDDGVYIRSVDNQGPLASSQVLRGDQILMIAAEDVTHLSANAVDTLLRCMHRPLIITFGRDLQHGQTYHIMSKFLKQETELKALRSGHSKHGQYSDKLVELARKDAVRTRQKAQVLNKRSKYVIHPNNAYKQYWDILILLLVLFNVVYLPMVFGFPDDVEENYVLNYFTDACFILDIILCFRSGFYTENGQLVMNKNIIRDKYIQGGWFAIDAISAFPFEIFSFIFFSDNSQGAEASQAKILCK